MKTLNLSIPVPDINGARETLRRRRAQRSEVEGTMSLMNVTIDIRTSGGADSLSIGPLVYRSALAAPRQIRERIAGSLTERYLHDPERRRTWPWDKRA